jgi:glycerophosphoryl diester phosphodiesterase
MKPGTLPDWPYPPWIAHRGAGTLAPENTLAAFRIGAGFGFRAMECDVKLSADDVPFLLHDATLDRTAGIAARAGDLDWSTLSGLDVGRWHSPRFAGEPPPCLDDIAAYVLGNGLALNLEIKPSPGTERHTGEVVARAVDRLWANAPCPPLLSSFQIDALQGARSAAPGLPRALLIADFWPGWLDDAQSLGCLAVVTHHRLMDGACLQAIHAAGLRGVVYTVNDAARAQTLLARGVDGLITDAVDRFSPAAAWPG